MTTDRDTHHATVAKGQATSPRKDTFLFIPHTHWEGAVFKTREDYLAMGLPNILRALRLLEEHPTYCFVLDQAWYVQPFLERYPEQEAAFRRFVAEGRLAIVGGTDVMFDGNMPGGESLVRQFLYGKGYFRRTLGVDVTTAWQLDTFGHHAQMPQLLKLAGFRSFWFFRGVAAFDGSVPSEFQWEGLDGSRLPAFWLPHAYANVYGSPASLKAFTAFMQERFEALTPFARGTVRVGLAGADVCEPEAHVPRLVEAFNRQAEAPFHLRFAVPAEYEAEVARRPDIPVVTGEMNPIFQGTYSSRIELKQRTRELEVLLTTAEKLGVLLQWLGAPADNAVLWQAWEPMLFNQAHDLMSGVMTDAVHEDTLRGYDFSRRIARDEVHGRARAITAHLDTRGKGTAVVVYNTLGWSRTDIARADVAFVRSGVRGIRLTRPDGERVPVQIAQATRHPDGTLIRAEVAFVARDVPALGHAVYRVEGVEDAADGSSSAAEDECRIENETCRVDLDPATGAITRLVLKGSDWDVLTGKGNVVAMEEDRGDFWELYRPLDAGSRVAMQERHPAPESGGATFSTDQAGKPGTVTRGPVFSEFTVAHPFGDTGAFNTAIRVHAGVRRVEIRTRILNQEQFVRYRVLFPTSVEHGHRTDEIPFGAIARPDGIEFPAQNWIDYGNGGKGVALLNRGLPGNNVADGVMMLSLMRSTCIVAYGYGGGYEPGMGSESGFELAKELTFDYALLPHTGDWRDAGVHREGMAFNHPLVVVTAASHRGPLPSQWGLVEIACPGVVVSSLKPGEDGGAVLRMYEATGRPADDVRVRLSAPVASAEEVNLMEDPERELPVSDNTLRLDFRPFEIKTVRLKLEAPRASPAEGALHVHGVRV